jgi:hypothetical protein
VTFVEAWQNLFAIFCADPETDTPVGALDTVDKVYMGEPGAGRASGVIFATVSPETLGVGSNDFKIRVYVNLDADALGRQLEWAVAVEAVEGLLTAEWTRGDWSFGYDPTLDRLVGEMTTTTYRE